MSEPARRQTVIDLLIEQERLAEEFYRRCSRKFPERDELWRALIRAEDTHAKFLEEIAADAVEASGFAERRLFAVNPLRITLGHLRRTVAALDGPGVTLRALLTVARDLENSVLERKVLEPFRGDSPSPLRKMEAIDRKSVV